MINLNSLFKNSLSISSIEEPILNEAERLLVEIEETRLKINYAWNHLDYAAPEYVEIAVLELLLVETQYSLLNKRYRLLLGINKDYPFYTRSTSKTSSLSLDGQLRNHAFYGALLEPASERPS
ncbi:MAG TPA: hypothetical protein VN456_01095 [Desulfosporosinus sp.]|nr:hypothetical protein [Desulfosporosinus sp.]